MLREDHRRRVARLLRGERRVADVERLFSDLRMIKPGRPSVREIGHFAAHRAERNRGISLERANDIQTSAKLWQKQSDGVPPAVDHLKEAGRANFNIITDHRIRERLGISRQTAEQSFSKALRKYAAGHPLKHREAEVLEIFGLSIMWQFALDDRELSADFADLLVLEGALLEAERTRFDEASQFITLCALSIMHGARLKMADGSMTQLRLAASEETGCLRIKAEIPLSEGRKPVTLSVPLFETSLVAVTYCDLRLLTFLDEPVPAEIEGGRLVALV
jgi:hypothetical protein